MINDEELRDRILGQLEEAGEDDAYGLLNSIAKPEDDISAVTTLARVLQKLHKDGLADVGLDGPFPRKTTWLNAKELSPLLDALPTRFTFDSVSGFWTTPGDPPHKQTILYVGLTKRGMEKAIEVMTARGGIWWTTKD